MKSVFHRLEPRNRPDLIQKACLEEVGASTLHRAALLLLLLMPLGTGCGERIQTSCDSVAERQVGITAQEYAPCAAEIISTLERLQPQLRALVRGDAEAAPAARDTYEYLELLLARSGFARDTRIGQPGRMVERWSDARVRAFNSAAFGAQVQYMSALVTPNKGNFEEGSRLHDQAEKVYRQIW